MDRLLTLEKAVARARASAWPWQLEEAAADAEKILERWRELGRVEAAMASRSAARLRRSLTEARRRHPSLDTREAEKLLSELDAEQALEGGDQRLKAYFAASKVAWAGGQVTTEAAAMLATIRQSMDITDAEHEQVTRAASAGCRTPAEEAAAAAASDTAARDGGSGGGGGESGTVGGGAGGSDGAGGSSDDARIGGPGNRVRFAARGGKGVRGPLFEGSPEEELGLVTAAGDPDLQLYVLNWDDPEVELYVGGAGPAEGFKGVHRGNGGGGGGDRSSSGGGGVIGGVDEATAAWAEAVPDEGSAGEEVTVVSGGGGGGGSGGGSSSSSAVPTRGWRRVGDTIIYNEEEVIGVGSSGTYVFRGYVQHTTRARHAVAVKRIARPPGEEGKGGPWVHLHAHTRTRAHAHTRTRAHAHTRHASRVHVSRLIHHTQHYVQSLSRRSSPVDI